MLTGDTGPADPLDVAKVYAPPQIFARVRLTPPCLQAHANVEQLVNVQHTFRLHQA